MLNKDKSTVSKHSNVSWAAYHASELEPAGGSTVITSLLPLFYDKAHSVAMIRHAMTVVKTAVDRLNPGQVPVLTADQPLYTLAKLIQWCWPDMYGEDTMVVMFGGLHIEMAADKVLGDLLEGSGWTGALVEAGVASSGHADSCLKGSQVTRTRWAHQVTTSALYLLMLDAYSRYCTDLEDGTNQKQMSMDEWRVVRSTESPQFKFWQLILDLELYVFLFIRSIRAADFLLYIESLSKIVPWFFVLDHPNYARWIPVHLRDMVTLQRKHPDVFNEFLAGNFTVKKTQRIFSFAALASTPEVQVVDSSMKKVERFVMILYDRTSTLEHVNDARKQLFTQKGRSIDGIPPTQAALLEHTKRAAFQAGHVWGQMMVPSPFLPSPGDWGWQRNEAAGKWDIFWTSLAEATSSCRELLRCGCKKGCKGQCKCHKAALQCTLFVLVVVNVCKDLHKTLA